VSSGTRKQTFAFKKRCFPGAMRYFTPVCGNAAMNYCRQFHYQEARMNTKVWQESGGDFLRESLLQEGRKHHFRHQPPVTLAAWLEYRRNLPAKLQQMAGSFPPASDLHIRAHGTLQQDGYRIVKPSYKSRVDLRVTVNLYIPDAESPFPGILGSHAHWSQGKIAATTHPSGPTLTAKKTVARQQEITHLARRPGQEAQISIV
jgi:hypothetical protein